jgi:hypothetical protein
MQTHQQFLKELTILYGARDIKSHNSEESEELPTELRYRLEKVNIEDETPFQELYASTQRFFDSERPITTEALEPYASEVANAIDSDQLSKAANTIVSHQLIPRERSLVTPDEHLDELLVEYLDELNAESNAELEQTSLGDQLSPTPHTLWQFPKSSTFAYFYYFTDDQYTRDKSEFITLDNQLTLLGRKREGLEVPIFDRDRMREQDWQLITEACQ